jgi:transketolase
MPTPSAVPHKDMANAIRALAMDAVQAANSGHPGMPMGMADVATVLFTKYLRYSPIHPDWPDRDRFVLSAGHGSMLLYALLYLTGYPDIDINQIRAFRQLGSRTPGHPEYGHAAGIETTTGPLGQGLANAVGMALAERLLNARHGDSICNHKTYVIAGDGCLMEGISEEAISLAGHLNLSNLIVLFDDNHISIDGPTGLATSVDQMKRFEAAGWVTMRCDGHNPADIDSCLAKSQRSDRPVMIACGTIIGCGAPKKQGSAAVHGSALGADEVAAARKTLGWDHPPFVIPDPVLAAWRTAGARSASEIAAWTERALALDPGARARLGDPVDAATLSTIDAAIFELKVKFSAERPKIATRISSQQVLEKLIPLTTGLIGGSADLTGSVGTKTSHYAPVSAGKFTGNYVHYGVREHGMAAAMNGLALHGGIVPFGGTFLVFSDYCRPAIRLSALMGARVVYIMTHDSIGLGEDGPTHQPVEHLAALRAVPNLNIMRPCDSVEVAECWQLALTSKNAPSLLALSRQNLPTLRTATPDNRCANGAYVLSEPDGGRHVTLIATGSEVTIAAEAADRLKAAGIRAAVVSMPCSNLFDRQPADYRSRVLGSALRVGIEAGIGFGWERWLGERGHFVGMVGFGASGPQEKLYEHFGITPERVVETVKTLMA